MAASLGNNGGRLYSFGAQPVLINASFTVASANANGRGVTALQGQGVSDVLMYTSQTAGRGPSGLLNPMAQTASQGYILVRLANAYNRFLGGFNGTISSPTTGSALNISSASAALTVGTPYIISSVGTPPAGVATIVPTADTSGSLASRYFTLLDSYGNTFVIWFNVSGIGARPNLGVAAPEGTVGFHYIQQQIASGATAAQVGAALVTTISTLPSGTAGVFSFTASGTTTVTVTSTANRQIPPIQDGSGVIPSQGPSVPITFTLASAGSATAGSIWTDGQGHLYTVSATISSQTTLQTTGVGAPNNGTAGTLTFVSGTGASTALPYTAAVAALSTGFTFALTTNETNLGDWQAVGLLKGLTPTVGQSFIAATTGSGSSTGQVLAAGFSNTLALELVGDPTTTLALAPQGGSPNIGGYILLKVLGLPASGQVPAVTQPANGSVVRLSFYVDARLSPSNNNSR